MNPGQHHLFIAICRKGAYFFKDVCPAAASHPSSGKGDNTVGTELVTPVLYFDVGPCMLPGTAESKAFILLHTPDVVYFLYSIAFFLKIPLQYLHNIFFPVISHHNINSAVKRLLFRLHIAACRHHYSIRIHLPGPVEHLPGLPVRNIGHCTGIDNINICTFPERNNLISVFFQKFLHSLRLICIYLAPKIMQRCFSHKSFFSFPFFTCTNCCNISAIL